MYCELITSGTTPKDDGSGEQAANYLNKTASEIFTAEDNGEAIFLLEQWMFWEEDSQGMIGLLRQVYDNYPIQKIQKESDYHTSPATNSYRFTFLAEDEKLVFGCSTLQGYPWLVSGEIVPPGDYVIN